MFRFFNGGILFSSAVLTFIALISLYSFLLLVKTKFVVSGSFGGASTILPWVSSRTHVFCRYWRDAVWPLDALRDSEFDHNLTARLRLSLYHLRIREPAGIRARYHKLCETARDPILYHAANAYHSPARAHPESRETEHYGTRRGRVHPRWTCLYIWKRGWDRGAAWYREGGVVQCKGLAVVDRVTICSHGLLDGGH